MASACPGLAIDEAMRLEVGEDRLQEFLGNALRFGNSLGRYPRTTVLSAQAVESFWRVLGPLRDDEHSTRGRFGRAPLALTTGVSSRTGSAATW